MRKLSILLLGATLLFAGCKTQDKKEVDASMISLKSNISNETLQESQSLDQASYKGLEHLFGDTSKIKFEGKYVLLIFGKNNCQWCDRLKDDIKDNQEIQEMIQKDFNAYYINISYSKPHQFMLEKNAYEVDTQTLARDFRVNATPTSVFLDPQGQPAFVLPGYLPPKQFQAFLKFISSEDYKDEAKAQQFFQSLQL